MTHLRARRLTLFSLGTVLGLLGALSVGAARATETSFRDSQGRETGRATTNSGGATTYRDNQGRETGRASTNSGGVTTYRDNQGRETGRSSAR